jgi:shikimate dehydrogenase
VSAADLPIVDGATRLFGIIGDPISQVGSPRMFTGLFRASGRNALMVPLHVRPDRFDETVRGLKALANLDGIVITIPYKARILAHVDRVLPMGEKVGAINAMRRDADGGWTGDMFDGRGLVRALRDRSHDPAGWRAMLIGAGGAGSALAIALADAGAAAIAIHDTDPAKSATLAARVAQYFPRCRVTVAQPTGDGCDILINASPIGMAPGDGLPAPLGRLDPTMLVFDVVLKSEPTPLLRHAESCGCRTLGGRAMMEAQADAMLEFLDGKG